jgi:hypothetical protein
MHKVIILIFLFLAGCGGSGGVSTISQNNQTATPAATPVITPVTNPVPGSVSGYIYGFDNNPESMVALSSALANPVNGYNPVVGVHIALMSDPRISSVTDENGFFRLDHVPASQIGKLTILQASHSKYLPLIFFSMSNQKTSSSDIVKLYILPESASIIMGRIIQFTCFGEDSSNRLINPELVNWQVEGNTGNIYQNGLFVATSSGKGKIIATVAGIRKEADIEVISTESTGLLRGQVTYSGNSPAKGLFVTTNVTSWSNETDSNGNYTLDHIPSGNRTLKIIRDGNIIWEGDVLIEKDKETIFNVALNLLPPVPAITSLLPDTAPPGAEIQITGTHFGSSQGNSYIKLGNNTVIPTFWSENLIKFIIPAGAISASVTVHVNGQTSNSVSLVITFITPTQTPQVNSSYKGQLINKSDNITVKRYESGQLKFEYKNTGTIEWDPNVVYLGTSHPRDRTTHLYTQNDSWASQTRIKMQETLPVNPGSTATFIFLVTPDEFYWSDSQVFELRADSNYKDIPAGWFGESSYGEIYVTVTDRYTYEATLTYKTPDITLNRYQSGQLTMKFRNTGTLEWHPNVVHLGTSYPHDRTTHLYTDDDTWLTYNRISMSQTSPVQPGEEGEFTFTITPDSEYVSSNQAFELVSDDIYNGIPTKWFGGNGYTEIKVTVSE